MMIKKDLSLIALWIKYPSEWYEVVPSVYEDLDEESKLVLNLMQHGITEDIYPFIHDILAGDISNFLLYGHLPNSIQYYLPEEYRLMNTLVSYKNLNLIPITAIERQLEELSYLYPFGRTYIPRFQLSLEIETYLTEGNMKGALDVISSHIELFPAGIDRPSTFPSLTRKLVGANNVIEDIFSKYGIKGDYSRYFLAFLLLTSSHFLPIQQFEFDFSFTLEDIMQNVGLDNFYDNWGPALITYPFQIKRGCEMINSSYFPCLSQLLSLPTYKQPMKKAIVCNEEEVEIIANSIARYGILNKRIYYIEKGSLTAIFKLVNEKLKLLQRQRIISGSSRKALNVFKQEEFDYIKYLYTGHTSNTRSQNIVTKILDNMRSNKIKNDTNTEWYQIYSPNIERSSLDSVTLRFLIGGISNDNHKITFKKNKRTSQIIMQYTHWTEEEYNRISDIITHIVWELAKGGASNINSFIDQLVATLYQIHGNYWLAGKIVSAIIQQISISRQNNPLAMWAIDHLDIVSRFLPNDQKRIYSSFRHVTDSFIAGKLLQHGLYIDTIYSLESRVEDTERLWKYLFKHPEAIFNILAFGKDNQLLSFALGLTKNRSKLWNEWCNKNYCSERQLAYKMVINSIVQPTYDDITQNLDRLIEHLNNEIERIAFISLATKLLDWHKITPQDYQELIRTFSEREITVGCILSDSEYGVTMLTTHPRLPDSIALHYIFDLSPLYLKQWSQIISRIPDFQKDEYFESDEDIII